jgi:DNA invertase Pin-like site-specific DNA recombinase
LSTQIAELKKAHVGKVFKEKVTGTTTDRKELNKLIKRIRPGDMLVVTKLDRLALNLIEPLLESGVTFNVLNLGIIESSYLGKFFLRTLLSIAEMERDMIIERTQAGKLYARLHNPNFREGRPRKLSPEKEAEMIRRLAAGGYSIAQAVKDFKVGKSTVGRIKKRRRKN